MASLGQELKQERESRNISLDEMAASTKIGIRYLQALEEDRLDIMPGGFFIKGIIRTYAGYIGLDVDAILAKYQAAGLLEAPSLAREQAPAAASDAKRNRLVAWILIGAGILLLLVVLTLVWRSSRRPRTAGTATQTQTALPKARPSSPPTTQPAKADSTPVETARQPAAEPAPPAREEWKGLTMDISFQEETWIQLDTDGVPKVVGLFPAGGKARAQAEREILIAVLGNAGGVTFTLNGQPGKILGRIGEVLNNVRITLDNQKEFLQNKQPPGPSN